jgi:hypothetical protein
MDWDGERNLSIFFALGRVSISAYIYCRRFWTHFLVKRILNLSHFLAEVRYNFFSFYLIWFTSLLVEMRYVARKRNEQHTVRKRNGQHLARQDQTTQVNLIFLRFVYVVFEMILLIRFMSRVLLVYQMSSRFLPFLSIVHKDSTLELGSADHSKKPLFSSYKSGPTFSNDKGRT